jgi:plastocyanin
MAVIGLALTVPGASLRAQTVHTVELQTLGFVPEDLTIKLGDTVEWVWIDGFHNVESGVIQDGMGVHDGNFRSGDPQFPPATYQVTFDQAFLDGHPMPEDRYPYYCVSHAEFGMKGSVTVVDCFTNEDCDDLLFCTGVETCAEGACAAGSEPCGQGEQCDEENDVCVPACVRSPEWGCDGDVDGNGVVNPVDVGLVQAAFCGLGQCDEDDLCQYDLDCNDAINPVDVGLVQSLFGTCDPPRDVCP